MNTGVRIFICIIVSLVIHVLLIRPALADNESGEALGGVLSTALFFGIAYAWDKSARKP